MSFFKWVKSLFTPIKSFPLPIPDPLPPVPLPPSPIKKTKDPIKVDPNAEPNWLTIARLEIGQKEVRKGENPRIIKYHMSTKLKATKDETPWCSSFVCFCLESAGYKSTRNAWARSFVAWGSKLKEPKLGCIVVFKRGEDSGHVGFFISESKLKIKVLGGNQKNSVCISEYNKSDLLTYRWPNT